ncbi:glycoside hydrolase family 5 protein [Acidomyces richmondensis BFW]|nr:glycoside hydrolase family 5 protein [Acidomyces richmondensis BFW]
MLFQVGIVLLLAWLSPTTDAAPGWGWRTVTVTETVTPSSTAAGTCSASSPSTSGIISSSTSSSTATISSASATSYPSTTYPTTPAYPICTSRAPFASIDDVHPRLFNYNGTGAKYFAGTNAWWTSYLMIDSDVNLVFSEIKNTQLQVVRIWGFGSVNTDPGPGTVFFQLLNSTGSYINYAANGIPRLDAVVSYAERNGVKIVLNFVNNWSALGGIASYNAAFGGNATSWYTDAESQKVYKDYIKLLVNRYKCSPAIFAWELANEPRCQGCDTSVIYNWATEVSQYIKSLDPRHMVALGDEGWFAPADGIGDGSYAYSGDQGVDFVKNLGIKTLDYGTFHLYPSSWGYNESWGSTWILQHNEVGAAHNKAVVLEEYGGPPTPNNHTAVEEPWQATVLKDTKLAMDQFWQFGTVLSTGLSDYDNFTIWYNSQEYVPLARDHAAAMLEKPV